MFPRPFLTALFPALTAGFSGVGGCRRVSNTEVWKDVDGNRIEAHGGDLMQEGDSWYWIGASAASKVGSINLYTLNGTLPVGSWRALGTIIPQAAIRSFLCTHEFDNNVGSIVEKLNICYEKGWIAAERPKVLFSELTGQYVMWVHIDYWKSNDYQLRAHMVSYAKSLTGPWTIHNAFQTGGQPALDFNLWKDRNTGEAYVVRSVDNRYAGLALLAENYLCTSKEFPPTYGSHRSLSNPGNVEACAIFRTDYETVYMICSELTGWEPNPAHLFKAYYSNGLWEDYRVPTLNDDRLRWKDLGNPTRSATSWNTQPASMVEIPMNLPPGQFPSLFLYMSDNWVHGVEEDGEFCEYPPHKPSACLRSAGYTWLPLLPDQHWETAMQDVREWSMESYLERKHHGVSREFLLGIYDAATHYGWHAIDTYLDPSRAPEDQVNGIAAIKRASAARADFWSDAAFEHLGALAVMRGWYAAQASLGHHEQHLTLARLVKTRLKLKQDLGPCRDYLVNRIDQMYDNVAWYAAIAKRKGEKGNATKNKELSRRILAELADATADGGLQYV